MEVCTLYVYCVNSWNYVWPQHPSFIPTTCATEYCARLWKLSRPDLIMNEHVLPQNVPANDPKDGTEEVAHVYISGWVTGFPADLGAVHADLLQSSAFLQHLSGWWHQQWQAHAELRRGWVVGTIQQ